MVRRGLDRHVVGRTIASVVVTHPRTVRRQPGGAAQFAALLVGRAFTGTGRRGKFLWLATDDPDLVLSAHLGMSGQFRVLPAGAQDPDFRHARAQLELLGPEGPTSTLWFVDQRTFGWVAAEPVVAGRVGRGTLAPLVPESVRDIAVDLLDPDFDELAVARRMHAREVAIKRQLLDQGIIAGIGNIYADESLWRAGIHPETPGDRISLRRMRGLLRDAADVLGESLAAGGTSFDSLYVNVNGESGYFGRGLNAYGRAGAPCPRCGTPIRRVAFANRSSHFCPACQRRR